jgi:hypothetical protein
MIHKKNEKIQLTYNEYEKLMFHNKRGLFIKYLPWKYKLSEARHFGKTTNQLQVLLKIIKNMFGKMNGVDLFIKIQ